MGFFDDDLGLGKVGEWVDDGLDYAEDFVNDFFHNPFDAIGKLAEDSLKTIFGVNLYKSFLPEVPTNNPVYQDRKVTTRSSLANHEIVYGRVKKGGSVVYLEASGTNDEFLHMIIVLASHSCDSIEEVYFGDILVGSELASGANDSQTFTIEADYVGKLVLYAQLGAHTAAFSSITSDSPANWTTNHILTGHTFLYMKMSYDRELYRRGIPSVTVVMKGKDDIYDPRIKFRRYTNNQALCCLDYLRHENGVGILEADVDMQSFEDAADHADDSLLTTTGGANEPRYAVSGVISVDRRPLDHLEELQKAGAAYITRSQGVWKYTRAEYLAPTLTLDESDLAGGLQFTPSASKEGRLNTVKGVYVSSENNYEATDYPNVIYDAYITADQEELQASIDYNFVDSPYQAQRLGKIAIERSRYGMMVSGIFKLNTLILDIGSRLNLTITALGINSAVFVVLDMGLSLAGGISLTLRQDDASIYTDTPTDRVALVAPPVINLPSPNPIAPTGLTISEELYSTNGGRDIKTRAIISWTETPGREQSFDIQFKESIDNEWSFVETNISGSDVRKDDMEVDIYDFRVRAINTIGWSGDWVTIQDIGILGKTAPPPNLEAIFIEAGLLSWTYPSAPLDLLGFEIRARYDGGSAWEDALPFHAGIITASSYDVSGVIGITTFLVKAIDTSGNYSDGAVLLPLELGDMVNITLSYSGINALITWPENTSELKTVVTVLEYDGAIIQETYDNRFVVPIEWLGSRTVTVRASFLPGYWGADAQVIINPNKPATPVVTARVIANSITLNYNSSKGSLPIDRYEIRRGGTYDAAQTPEIKAGTSSFTISDETAAGTVIFWFEAVDTAGNRSDPVSVSAIVSQPQNYQLLVQYSAKTNSWPGALTNCQVTASGSLLLPINTTETWAEHFTDNSFNTPQDQIDAGYEYYLQPSTTTAQYQFTYDYLSLIDSATITANSAPIILDGSVTVAVHIEFSEDNISWESGGAGQTQALATAFRYIRVTLDFAAIGGDDLAYVEDVLISIDKRIDDDSGKFAAVSTDTNGTRVYFNKDFIDAQTPTVSVSSTEIIDVIVYFNDIPDPEYFDVYVFSRSTGLRINANFSWIARGFTRIGV
jgi:hypothetical protein